MQRPDETDSSPEVLATIRLFTPPTVSETPRTPPTEWYSFWHDGVTYDCSTECDDVGVVWRVDADGRDTGARLRWHAGDVASPTRTVLFMNRVLLALGRW